VCPGFQPACFLQGGYEKQNAGANAEGGFYISFTIPHLLGDCGTGRSDKCCSFLSSRKQKSLKFCLLKYGKDEK